ncbi:translation initiation factor IF-2-like [Physeter macrocephalus]|uniref:Translation initiation factor IF-2-like n=1 Tax=Physeter macrocephalus TaxID=9755 RepID=A0A455B0H4_PHYMC|nr:translation initiation factor IF-2-like [Physeter catodon]|eukprot:XP_028342277.1 uncharacterized protein LOC114485299 [Physeter catodon]
MVFAGIQHTACVQRSIIKWLQVSVFTKLRNHQHNQPENNFVNPERTLDPTSRHCPSAFCPQAAFGSSARPCQAPGHSGSHRARWRRRTASQWPLQIRSFLAALRRPRPPARSVPSRPSPPTQHCGAAAPGTPRSVSRLACSSSGGRRHPPHTLRWAGPSPPPSQRSTAAAAARNHRAAPQEESRPGESGSSGSHLRKETSGTLWSGLPLGKADPPLAARPAPRPDAGADGSTPGDLTRQHGGGGRLGLRVGAATATATGGSCTEQLPPPPRFHLFGGTGLDQCGGLL